MLLSPVGVQLSELGLYLPPSAEGTERQILIAPPQMIISLPVHTAV